VKGVRATAWRQRAVKEVVKKPVKKPVKTLVKQAVKKAVKKAVKTRAEKGDAVGEGKASGPCCRQSKRVSRARASPRRERRLVIPSAVQTQQQEDQQTRCLRQQRVSLRRRGKTLLRTLALGKRRVRGGRRRNWRVERGWSEGLAMLGVRGRGAGSGGVEGVTLWGGAVEAAVWCATLVAVRSRVPLWARRRGGIRLGSMEAASIASTAMLPLLRLHVRDVAGR
jgi:hypothetical protein